MRTHILENTTDDVAEFVNPPRAKAIPWRRILTDAALLAGLILTGSLLK
jgi:hypothetical protein